MAADLARERGIIFHTDAVQSAGKIPISLKGNSIDMLSISGHKLHAPKGIGILYVRKGTKFSPFLIGGHQEENAGVARKTRRASSDWARPANWPPKTWTRKIRRYDIFGTN